MMKEGRKEGRKEKNGVLGDMLLHALAGYTHGACRCGSAGVLTDVSDRSYLKIRGSFDYPAKLYSAMLPVHETRTMHCSLTSCIAVIQLQ